MKERPDNSALMPHHTAASVRTASDKERPARKDYSFSICASIA